LRWLMSAASWAGINPVRDADKLRSLLRNTDPWEIIDELQTGIARHHGITREDAAHLIQQDVKSSEDYYHFTWDAESLGLPSARSDVQAWFDQRIGGPSGLSPTA
jgi:hypothetical protein